MGSGKAGADSGDHISESHPHCTDASAAPIGGSELFQGGACSRASIFSRRAKLRWLFHSADFVPPVPSGLVTTLLLGKCTVNNQRPLPGLYNVHTLPDLHALTTRAWAALAHARRTHPSRPEWEVVDTQLRLAADGFRRFAFPGSPEQASTSPATLPSHLNVAGHRLCDAAFAVDFALARVEQRVTDEWLLLEAPSSVQSTAWTAALENALRARGLRSESGWPSRVKAPDLTSYARCGPHVADALHALYTVATPLLYGEILHRYGQDRALPLLLARVDFAISDFDRPSSPSGEDMKAARRAIPAFLTLREALMSWATPSTLLPLAERCMAALDVPSHLRGAPGPVT